MNMDEEAFVQETFSKNRERLMKHHIAEQFFATVVEQVRSAELMSDEHFTADGTLIEAWASLKSFQRKGEDPKDRPPPDDKGNPTVDFHGEKRSNDTHQSTTDPEAKRARKGAGKEAKLSYAQHALMENRNGLLVELQVTETTGTSERETALSMVNDYLPGDRRLTLGGDKGYDTRRFAERCQQLNVTPHVAQNTGRAGGSAVDGRTTRHRGYAISQRIRKRVEEIFGWTKTIANFRKPGSAVSTGRSSPRTWWAPRTTCCASLSCSSGPLEHHPASAQERRAPMTSNGTLRLHANLSSSHARFTALSREPRTISQINLPRGKLAARSTHGRAFSATC